MKKQELNKEHIYQRYLTLKNILPTKKLIAERLQVNHNTLYGIVQDMGKKND
jgi:hypothetical protein